MDRRTLLQTSAAAAIASPAAGSPRPHPTILVSGARHPVTAKFEAEVLSRHPDLIQMSYDDLVRKRDAILHLSDLRNRYLEPTPNEPMAKGGTITVREQDRLDAIVHVINVHHAVSFLQGRGISDFGFEGVDQVHGNAAHRPCGCIHTFVFDHHRRHEAQVKTHPHYPKFVCAEHAARA